MAVMSRGTVGGVRIMAHTESRSRLETESSIVDDFATPKIL
jgi:hypothetical protein